MKTRLLNLFFLLFLAVVIVGCAATEKPAIDTNTPKTTATASALSIYPDNSKGKNYDKYDAIVLRGRIVTMAENDSGFINVLDNGRIVIVGEKIEAVLAADEKLPKNIDSTDAIHFDTHGIIFPGIINAHDHLHYNHIPLWDCPEKYTNRYQWSNTPDCKENVKYAKNVVEQKKYWGVQAEAMKYSESKHLVGGTTSCQGSPNGSKKFCRMLVRNMDVSPNFGFQHQSAYVRNVTEVKPDKIQKWIDKMDAGELDAIFYHIAEGTDEKALSEFEFLVENGLGRKEVIIIHGTALEEPEIRYMADYDMTVIWSPVSNLLLYGATADIPTYMNYGVNVCLGTDWAPSGSKNLLGEMKVAYEYSNAYFDSLLTYRDIVEMVTCNPADAVGWRNYVGRIKRGLYADIFIIDDTGGNPFEALVKATERNVNLVFIGGEPLYGDSIYMSRLKPGDFEYIQTNCGFTKCIDFTDDEWELGDQSLAYVVKLLEKVMRFDENEMEQQFTDSRVDKYYNFTEYLDAKFSGYKSLHLDPLYACTDEHFFRVLRTNKNASLPFDIEKLYYSHK